MEEPAGRRGRVGPVRLELLDGHRLILDPPDLGDCERGIDARPVDLGRRDVDFDCQIGVGIVGDVVGSKGDRRGTGRQLGGVEVIALVGFQAPLQRGPIPRRRALPPTIDFEAERDLVDEHADQLLEPIVDWSDNRDLDVLPVISQPDRRVLAERAAKAVVEVIGDVAHHAPLFAWDDGRLRRRSRRRPGPYLVL